MSTSYVEEFYRAHTELIGYLINSGQPSFASDANDNFRRSLVLAIASYFEHEISEVVRKLPVKHAQGNPFLMALVEQKAVSRQYHTYFQWDGPNANRFFSLFGAAYKEAAEKKFKEDGEFKASVQAFLSLGDTRNKLVHENYVRFSVDLTPEDIIARFRQAEKFLDYVRETLLPPQVAPIE
ncbi:HEPN domain-containing protein [Xanthobacter autotrophicus]|uniref:HEPN domain-containing protein n=1 Tax=Xanthobacter autotrophicus TaxID=280 RepID=UPI0037288832